MRMALNDGIVAIAVHGKMCHRLSEGITTRKLVLRHKNDAAEKWKVSIGPC